MPTFNTGNAQWDQGLSTLGNALFPDPSKMAQGYYYGSEARKAQIEAAKLQDQMAASHTALGMTFGNQPNPTYRPGAMDTTIMVDPRAQQAAAPAAPPAASVAPAAAPPAAATPPPMVAAPPPPAGQVGANMAPGGLSALFAQGGGAVPGGYVPQTMSPEAASQAIAAKVQAMPAPPLPGASPPTPSTPPAPNTTGSDGSVPRDANEGSGALHGASFTPAGGGVKMAGPAAADGSPAPAAFNLGQYVALAVAGGVPADQAATQGRAVIMNWVKNGQMDQTTAERLLVGYGVTEPRVASIHETGATQRTAMTEAGATQRTAMTEAGATQRQHIVTDEQGRQFNLTPVETVDGQGNKTYTLRADIKSGTPAYDSSVATTRAGQTGAYGNYIDPKDPSAPAQHVPAAVAEQRGLVQQPTSSDQWTATMNQAIASETDPAKRQALIERYASVAAIPKAVDAEAAHKQRQVDYKTDQEAYPQPQQPAVPLGITNNVAFTPAAQEAINTRTMELQAKSLQLRNNPTLAHIRAIQTLQQDGTLPSVAEVNKTREAARARLHGGSDPRVSLYQAPGSDKGVDHLMIDVKTGGAQPAQPAVPNAPTAPAAPVVAQPPAPVVSPAQPLSTVPGLTTEQRTGTQPLPVVQPVIQRDPTQANSPLNSGVLPQPTVPPRSQLSPTQMPTTDIPAGGFTAAGTPAPAPTQQAGTTPSGPAPAGAREGQVVYDIGGRPAGVVHNGQVYPIAARGP